jgi:hypothetical protein
MTEIRSPCVSPVIFCLRLKKNEFIEIEDGVWKELNDLRLKPGVSLFIEGINAIKRVGISHPQVYCRFSIGTSMYAV